MKTNQNFSTIFCSMIISALGFTPQSATALNYQVNPLVSNIPSQAPNLDTLLINPWGLFFVPNGNFWTADNGSNLSTLYQPDGTVVPFVITADSAPSGALLNIATNQSDFLIGTAPNQSPAQFLFSTENGTIIGFNSLVDPANSILAVDNSTTGTVYKGLELATTCCSQNLLFATDFFNRKIDVLDGTFSTVGEIRDLSIPAGFAPFNVKLINNLLYVTYAKQLPPANHDDQPGPGNGYVDIFTTAGTLVQRLISQGNLNSPWGLALAPSTFGQFAGDLLVGNFGDGTINAYDPQTGAFQGTLSDSMGNPIVIDGLWALEFNSSGVLYFSSGPDSESNGLVGTITPL